jgi:hypothetical protein
MQTTTPTAAAGITVTIARIGAETRTLTVAVGSTLEQVFSQAGISIASNESVYWNGEQVGVTSVVDNNDYISIVQNKQGGTK